MEPSPDAAELAERIGVDLNHYRFCATDRFAPVATSRPGIFVCGAFEAPKDIPETVMQASSAAARAQALLADARYSEIEERSYPEELDVSEEEPRIGVFVCDCGINIASVIRVPEVKEYAATLPGVVFSDENLFTCSQDNIQRMIEVIREKKLNRVVVASCSPRTHEPLFRETIRQAGLNPYLFEMANIRDQGSWVHQQEPDKATEKAKDLVRMAVAKVRHARPLQQLTVPVEQSALVIGGGVAGMNAAINIAEQGYAVHLVEKSSELGGVARRIHYTIEGDDVLGYLDQLRKRVQEHPKIQVHLQTEVVDHSGFVGNFVTRIISNGSEPQEIRHGVTVVATGAQPYEPQEYLYGEDPRVLTSLELEERIAEGDHSLRDLTTVVMIQCVGSRNEERPYCSRICCQGSIKNALRLKEINPDMQIFILYRDIRTYGLLEDNYREAREKGVLFIRFEKDQPPRVERGSDGLRVFVRDHVLGEEVEIRADLLALAVGIVGDTAHPVSTQFKLPLNADGFFMEAHMKLRPVDFASEGNFLAGLAHGPKPLKETIAQAEAAASRAVTILSKERLYLPGEKAWVEGERCVACLTCVRACPYHVPQIGEEGVAEIEPAACQGCGICTSACPRKAIHLANYTDEEILAKVAALQE
jgi:heterodisulfide reductase subunit A